MAVPAEKVKARIKALFPKTNLTASRIDAIAAKLAPKPADDADDAAIDEVINQFNEDSVMTIEELAKLDDKLRQKTAPPKSAAPEETPKEKDETGESDNAILAALKALQTEISQMKTEKIQQTLAQRFSQDERLKDVPKAMLKGRVPSTEEDYETSVTELVSDWAEISGTVNDTTTRGRVASFVAAPRPAAGAGAGPKPASSEVTDAMAKRLL